MQSLALSNYGTVEMNSTEMVSIDGGNIYDIINTAWNLTPEGGSSSWTNYGTGNFNGSTSGGLWGTIYQDGSYFTSQF